MNMIFRAVIAGVLGGVLLLALYFFIVSAISGWEFAQGQFASFRYYILALALGFGVQAALYAYLRQAIRRGRGSGKVLAVTGTNSTVAMISCCAHYLANILPVLGATGFLALISQYQVELFWVGLASNAFGTAYIARKIVHYESDRVVR